MFKKSASNKGNVQYAQYVQFWGKLWTNLTLCLGASWLLTLALVKILTNNLAQIGYNS